jgi:hypothetical protein
MTTERPIYRLRLQALPHVDAVKALRAALKNLLRKFGLRVLSIEVETPQENNNG